MNYNVNFQFNFVPTRANRRGSVIIQNSNSSSATGYDDISSEVLKSFSPKLPFKLAHLINIHMQKSDFPTVFKIARIQPAYKKGDKLDYNNYRPIISPFVHLFSRNYLKYTKLYFTIDYMIFLLHEIALDFFNNNIFKTIEFALFIDLQKAFYSLDHNILLEKLKSINVNDSAFNLFK